MMDGGVQRGEMRWERSTRTHGCYYRLIISILYASTLEQAAQKGCRQLSSGLEMQTPGLDICGQCLSGLSNSASAICGVEFLEIKFKKNTWRLFLYKSTLSRAQQTVQCSILSLLWHLAMAAV